MKEKGLSKIKPKASGILICDTVVTDETTKKKSLINIFENIYSRQFPCIHGSLSLYTKLSDAAGDYKFHLELYDLDQNRKIGEGTTSPISITDRNSVNEIVFNLAGLIFDHPGKYEFRLFANDEPIESKTFNVSSIS